MNIKHDHNASTNPAIKQQLEPELRAASCEAKDGISGATMLKWLDGEELLDKQVGSGSINAGEDAIFQKMKVKNPRAKGEASDGDVDHITLTKVTDLMQISTPNGPEFMMVEFINSSAAKKEIILTRFKR